MAAGGIVLIVPRLFTTELLWSFKILRALPSSSFDGKVGEEGISEKDYEFRHIREFLLFEVVCITSSNS